MGSNPAARTSPHRTGCASPATAMHLACLTKPLAIRLAAPPPVPSRPPRSCAVPRCKTLPWLKKRPLREGGGVLQRSTRRTPACTTHHPKTSWRDTGRDHRPGCQETPRLDRNGSDRADTAYARIPRKPAPPRRLHRPAPFPVRPDRVQESGFCTPMLRKVLWQVPCLLVPVLWILWSPSAPTFRDFTDQHGATAP